MDFLLLEPLRAAATQIDRILMAFYQLITPMITLGDSGYFYSVVNTILNNEYLLISVSLLIIGFVIAIIKRVISL